MTQSLGGTVGLRSQLGAVSTFQVRLPLAEQPTTTTSPMSSKPTTGLDVDGANPANPGSRD